MLKLDAGGKLSIEDLNKSTAPFRGISRDKNGKCKYAVFSNYMGIKTDTKTSTTSIHTAIGRVAINVKSQFWKMLRNKEDRSSVLMNIKNTLKFPLMIGIDGDSIFFFGSYKKSNGKIFNMVSVCAYGEKDKSVVLKTSYEIKKISKMEQFLRGDRGEIKYLKQDGKVKKEQGNHKKMSI